MNQSTINADVNSGICDAVGCFTRATTCIEVKVGHKGIISLSLCDDCISKFAEDEENL